jgi:peptidyl-prolyl cis-trans isomerase C
MKRAIQILCALLAVAGIALAEDAAPKGSKLTPDTLIARVNNKDVPYWKYQMAMKAVLSDIKGKGRHSSVGMESEKVRDQILLEVVRRTALVQEAALSAPPELDKLTDTSFTAFRKAFPSTEVWEKMLKDENLDEDKVKSLCREDVLLENYMETVVSPRLEPITDADALKHYAAVEKREFARPDQVELRHILIKAHPEDAVQDEISVHKIAGLRERIVKGEDFAAVAAKESDDGMTRQFGGLLGYRGRGDLPKEVGDACFALKEGEVSQVVRSQFGYHIFLAMSKRPAATVSFTDAKAAILQGLRSKALRKAMDDKATELVSAAKVEVLLPHVGGGQKGETP